MEEIDTEICLFVSRKGKAASGEIYKALRPISERAVRDHLNGLRERGVLLGIQVILGRGRTRMWALESPFKGGKQFPADWKTKWRDMLRRDYDTLFGEERANSIKGKLRSAAMGNTHASVSEAYISKREKMMDPTWKVMMLPPVHPWKATGDSIFAAERDGVMMGLGRRW